MAGALILGLAAGGIASIALEELIAHRELKRLTAVTPQQQAIITGVIEPLLDELGDVGGVKRLDETPEKAKGAGYNEYFLEFSGVEDYPGYMAEFAFRFTHDVEGLGPGHAYRIHRATPWKGRFWIQSMYYQL